MNRKGILLLTWLSLLYLPLIAQITVSGIVLDKATQEPLPFVNIQALPSNEGASTDFEGAFTFKTFNKLNKLQFTYLGYETNTLSIGGLNQSGLVVELNPTGVQIEETVVMAKGKKKKKIPKDTLAISLQQKVVANKELNRPAGFDSYSYKEHAKIEFDYYKLGEKFRDRIVLRPFRYSHEFIDTTHQGVEYLPLLLQEKISQHYYKSDPSQEKNIVLGQYMTGIQNLSAAGLLDAIFENFNLYDNIIIAGGKSFTSPFSSSGLLTYRFYLTDSSEMDGHKFFRLDFSPKAKEALGFNGYAWIDGESYALKSIEFSMPRQANLNFVGEFKVKQEFEEVDSSKWMLAGEYIQVALSISGKPNSKSLLVKKSMHRGNIEVNQDIPAAIFEGEKEIISDSLKGGRDKIWWAENRINPLTQSEAGVVLLSDSIERTKAFRNLSWVANTATTAFLKFGPVEFGRFYQFLSWNSVEGIRPKLGIRTNKDWNENMQLWAYMAYGTEDKQFKYFANARIKLPRKNNNWHILELNYKKDYTFLGQDYEDQQFSHDNMFLALLRTEPLQKIMLLESFKLMHERQWVNGYTTKLTAGTNTFYAVEDVFDFERVHNNGTRESFESFNTTEISLDQHIAFGQTFFENQFYRFETISNKPIFDIGYTVGLPDIAGSDFAYHKLDFTLRQRLSSKIGYTYYNLSGGKIFGDIPYPLMFLPIGNQSIYFNGRAFQLLNEFEFAADQFVSGSFEHHFDGAIFNRIPGISKLKLRSIIAARALIGNASQSNLDIMDLPPGMRVPDNWYVEAGFGIENILQLLRVDFYWRVTQRYAPNAQNFGIRVSFAPKL